ncbi:MAG: hypothetical protein WB791_05965 [Waddliaceae bacterium]
MSVSRTNVKTSDLVHKFENFDKNDSTSKGSKGQIVGSLAQERLAPFVNLFNRKMPPSGQHKTEKLVVEKPVEESKSAAPPKTSAMQKVARRIESWLRNRSNEKVTKAGSALELLLPQAARGKDSFLTFNDFADELKSVPNANWKEEVSDAVSKLPLPQQSMLCLLSPSDLRGYDREVVSHIYDKLKETTKEQDPDVKEKLDRLTEFLKTGHIHTKDVKPLGGGAVNVVSRVKYGKNGEKTGVFKPEPKSWKGGISAWIQKAIGTAEAAGIPSGAEGHFLDRFVASSVVDGHLFGDERISVKTTYHYVNGERGILMEKAKGSSPKVAAKQKTLIDADDPELGRFLRLLGKERIKDLSKDNIAFLRVQLKCRELKKKKVDGEWKLQRKDAVFADEKKTLIGANDPELRSFLGRLEKKRIEDLSNDNIAFFKDTLKCRELKKKKVGGEWKLQMRHEVNLDNPTTAEGLLKLQVFDWITGQVDRHPENYMIDDDGKVMAIDNDCSFGTGAVIEGQDVRKQARFRGIVPNNASLMLRKPPVMTQSIMRQIRKLAKEDRTTFCQELELYLSEKEVDATMQRLDELADHTQRGCMIVPTADDLLTPQSKERMNSNNSYWMREKLIHDKDKRGWNHLRAHREF